MLEIRLCGAILKETGIQQIHLRRHWRLCMSIKTPAVEDVDVDRLSALEPAELLRFVLREFGVRAAIGTAVTMPMPRTSSTHCACGQSL